VAGLVAAAPASAAAGRPFTDTGVLAFGDATPMTPPAGASLISPAVAIVPTADGSGLWVISASGEVIPEGTAVPHGSLAGVPINAPIVAATRDASGGGYWLAGLDGNVYPFGDAPYFGSMRGTRLNQPIVGMAATPDGHGYWEVAADGGIFSFGDAPYLGSMGGTPLNSPIVGIAATPDGHGYWEVAADGGIFSFGDAPFLGSLGGKDLSTYVIGMQPTTDGEGYLLAGNDGSVHAFGDGVAHGGNSGEVPTPSITAFAATPDAGGYWMLDAATIPTSFTLNGPAAVVAAAATQLDGNPNAAGYCNPYGPCEEWCALFATWAWERAGVGIPRYPFTGSIYDWASAYTEVITSPHPGDAVLYGSGPDSTASSVHVGIVAEIWPDGAIVTIEGDAGPGPPGSTNVDINGPFLPSDSLEYNGYGIYGYAVP
jgi:hypothetical protein